MSVGCTDEGKGCWAIAGDVLCFCVFDNSRGQAVIENEEIG